MFTYYNLGFQNQNKQNEANPKKNEVFSMKVPPAQFYSFTTRDLKNDLQLHPSNMNSVISNYYFEIFRTISSYFSLPSRVRNNRIPLYLDLFALQMMVVGVPGEVGQPVVKHVEVLRLHEKETVIIPPPRMEASRVSQRMLKKLRLTVINLAKVSR